MASRPAEQELTGIVTVAARERDGERASVAVDDQMLLRSET
ncbi:hypothetical protein ABZS95_14170 [Streptomyces sp. NPDC005479]